MKIVLGEAAHCEHAGAYGYESGHTMGNDTGDELRLIGFYPNIGGNSSTPWVYVFRSRDENVANALAVRCRQAVANRKIGYGQPTRSTFVTRLLEADYDPSRISSLCDADCSSLVNSLAKISWLAIGHTIPLNGLETTAEMPTKYKAAAMSPYFTDVTAYVNLKTGDGLRVGDILCRPSTMGAGHTAIVVSVEETKTGTVTTTLCLRKRPKNGAVIGYLPKGATVRIKNTDDATGWYFVEYSGKEGYCSNRYVSV